MSKASYWAQDVYKMLDVGASTLRRWASELESKGWEFDKVDGGKRRYYEHDLNAFRSIKEMNEHQGMTIDEAINAVISKHNISSHVGHNMLIERQNDSAELALSIQKEVKELQELFAKGYYDLKQDNKELITENKELKDEVVALREELRVYIAYSKEEKQEPGFLARIAGALKKNK